VPKVTDPRLLSQLNGGGSVVAPNPMFPGQLQGQMLNNRKAEAELPFAAPKAQADASRAGSEATIAGAQAPFARDIAQANRDKAKYDADTAKINASGQIRLTPQVRAEALAGFRFSEQLQQTADALLGKFNAGPGATHGLHGLEDYLPYTANQQFDTAAQKSRGIVGQTLGFTGGQLNTPREAEQAVGPFIPQSADRDPVAMDKIASLHELARNGREKAIQILGGVPDENGNVTPVNQTIPQPPAADPLQLSGSGKTRAQIDPVLRAVGSKVGAMLVNGTSDGKIIQFLHDSGVDPTSTNVAAALKARKGPDFKAWMRYNPGKSYPVGPEFYTKQIPMTGARQLFNKTAATDIGGDVAAGLTASANAISGDRLSSAVGALSGDPQGAQTGMELLRTNHPGSSFAGDLAGQASLEALAGTVPGVRGLMMTRWGRRAGDIGYGAYSGSGDNSNDSGVGAAEGGGLGLATGMFGRGAQKVLGHTLTGVRDAGLGYLHSKDIPLTLGQIARGVGNIGDTGASNVADEVGKGVGGIEERLAGLPGLEAWIKTARQRGDVGLNKEAFRQIAPGVTGTGADGLVSAKAAETAAYAKLNPVRISVDAPFELGLSTVEQNAKGLAHHAGDVADVVSDIRNQIGNGEMTGKGYQTALQTIRKTRSTLNDDVGGRAAKALNDLEERVIELGNRQGGHVAQDLAEANAIHARRQIVKQASKGAGAQSAGEMFSAKDLNRSAISNTERFGGLDRALSSDRPFYELTSNAMKAMPNLTQDSGTAGRMALLGLLAGAGGGIGGAIGGLTGEGGAERTGEGSGLGIAGGLTLGSLLAAPYSRGGQRIIQNALLGQRPRKLQSLGDFLINNPRLAGLLSQAGGRDYFQQPELPK
jgi:hypothetical protein